MNKKYLSIMGDDFGMCSAINEGMIRSFQEGLLTDTNVMAPCPAFDQAMELARQTGIPVGLHGTFTAEWDLTRWGPLTAMKTMRAGDGGFRHTVDEAWSDSIEEEALAELRAQFAAVEASGITCTHIGEHMGIDPEGRFLRSMQAVSAEQNLPHKGHWIGYAKRPMAHFVLRSVINSGSASPQPETKQRLIKALSNLEPGHHMWVTHPAIDDPSMDELNSPDRPNNKAARHMRVIDYGLLNDPEIKDLIENLEIQVVPLSSVPTAND